LVTSIYAGARGRVKMKIKFISIKTKLVTAILPLTILIIVVLSSLLYKVSKDVIESDARGLLKTSAEGQSAKIEAWLGQNLSSFNVIKHTIEKMDLDGEELQEFLNLYKDFDSNYPGGLYVAEKDGRLYKPETPEEAKNNTGLAGSTDFSQAEWFTDGLTRVNMDFTNAYTNENGQQIISASGMLQTYKDNIRVISADLSLDKVSVYVNSFIKMKGAEAFLVNTEDNTIIASLDTSLISQKLDGMDNSFMKTVSEKIAKDEMDITEIDGNLSVFEEIAGTQWLLVSYVPSKIVYKDLDNVRNIMLVAGIISVIVLAILIERTVHIVINPVKKLTAAIRTMTEGDFTTAIKTKSKDEIGVMCNCVEKFASTMCKMIASINVVSNTLHTQAGNSNDISDMMFNASSVQNKLMKELNTTVEQLSDSINDLACNATTLADVASETKEDGSNVNNRMKETINISRKGKEDMQDVSTAIHNIDSSVSKLQDVIDEVGQASEEITNITKVISDIADETNLLSLNASIEAARAGEAGKGFTVVASEIGKLAQTSMSSVQDIDNLVVKIKAAVWDVVRQAEESAKNINNSNVLIGNALKTFDLIFENIATTGSLVNNMIKKVEEVDNVARSVAAISEEQAASSEEILSSSDTLVAQADELMANSGNVAKEAKKLTASAEQLTAQMEIFKTR